MFTGGLGPGAAVDIGDDDRIFIIVLSPLVRYGLAAVGQEGNTVIFAQHKRK